MTRGVIPQGFALVAPGMTVNDLARRHGVGRTTVWKWCVRTGVRPRRATPQRSSDRAASRRLSENPAPHRDVTQAGLAADYLRKFGEVIRCDAVGNPLQDGFFWRRGGRFVLTDDEIIQRAIHNGWRKTA
jgi:transposase-like protein